MTEEEVYQPDIEVYGAREHNLKNIDVVIPHRSLTVITGLSGSGKSSLAFDTLFAEGQRRYIETFSAYARNFLGGMRRPDVDKISGLSPVISIEQKTTNKNPRSTVGTTTEVYDYFRLLFARAADAYSYESGERMVKYTEEKIIELILNEYEGRAVMILAPLAATLIRMAISRSREFLADETGARISGSPLALASALTKLEAYSRRLPLRNANPSTEGMFIVSPLTGGGIQNLFRTHPTTEERVERLKTIAAGAH